MVETLEHVKIEAKDVTVISAMKGKAIPHAVLLNQGNWAQSYFSLDKISAKFFEEKLGLIENALDRAVIIN
jgi:hypothetical protein